MIVDKRLLWGYGTIVHNFSVYCLELTSVALHKYKIGEKVDHNSNPDIRISMSVEDYFELEKKLKSQEDIFEFKDYIFDFSKGGCDISRNCVLECLQRRMSTLIQPLLAC